MLFRSMDYSPTLTASAISPPLASFCISRRLHHPPTATPISAAHGPSSSADTAAHRCLSSTPSHALSTSADRRLHRVHHELPLLNRQIFPVGASSKQADTNAHCHDFGYPALLHATTFKIRILPHRHCKPRRRGHPIGPAIQLPVPSASVQIPIAHRIR